MSVPACVLCSEAEHAVFPARSLFARRIADLAEWNRGAHLTPGTRPLRRVPYPRNMLGERTPIPSVDLAASTSTKSPPRWSMARSRPWMERTVRGRGLRRISRPARGGFALGRSKTSSPIRRRATTRERPPFGPMSKVILNGTSHLTDADDPPRSPSTSRALPPAGVQTRAGPARGDDEFGMARSSTATADAAIVTCRPAP